MLLDVLLIAALAWGAFAFGAVYPSAYWPLAAAASTVGIAGLAIGARGHGSVSGLGLTPLAIGFCTFLWPVSSSSCRRRSPSSLLSRPRRLASSHNWIWP